MKRKRASNIEVKKINRIRTFRTICSAGRISKPEIASSQGVSLPTVQQNIKDLLSLGLVQEDGEFESTGGRKASAISVVKNSVMAVGIDITRDHISFVLTDLSGENLKHVRLAETFINSSIYYEELAVAAMKFKEEFMPAKGRFLGFGISIPGIVDKENRTILYSHTLGLNHLPCSRITEHFSDPCVFINDANAACFAEVYHQPHPENTVYLSLSQSVGGTFILDNEDLLSDSPFGESLYAGDNNRSSEFGHMTLYPEGRICYCGKTGCVDAYCSAKVLSMEAGDELTDFFTRLSEGDLLRADIWDVYQDNLAIVINNIRMLYDARVILGGEVGSFLKPYLENLKERVSRRNTFEADASYLTVCLYNVESSALGAALVQIEGFINQI